MDSLVVNTDKIGKNAYNRGYELPVRILINKENRFYIGTFHEKDGIVSRESKETWDKRINAEKALVQNDWTQFTPKQRMTF